PANKPASRSLRAAFASIVRTRMNLVPRSPAHAGRWRISWYIGIPAKIASQGIQARARSRQNSPALRHVDQRSEFWRIPLRPRIMRATYRLRSRPMKIDTLSTPVNPDPKLAKALEAIIVTLRQDDTLRRASSTQQANRRKELTSRLNDAELASRQLERIMQGN